MMNNNFTSGEKATGRQSMLNVRDISDFLYCERKSYLKTVLRLKEQVSPAMIRGRIRHEILDELNKAEPEIIKNIRQQFTFEELGDVYKQYLRDITTRIFLRNKEEADEFGLNEELFWRELWRELRRDIQLRIKSISQLLAKEIYGDELWNKLEPRYLTEIKITSIALGLVGRIDRLMISKQEGQTQYIPYEVKNTTVLKPYPSDLVQLSAYSVLLEQEYGVSVNKGVMEYKDKRVHIPVSPEMKAEVHDIMKKIRNFPNEKMPQIIDNFKKCMNCGLREQCYNL